MGTIIKIQLRRDTFANWTAQNPILEQGEPALETDTGRLKFGDGVNNYNDLPYFCDNKEIRGTAGESIVFGRAVVSEAGVIKHFDKDTASHYGRVLGISKGSASIGTEVVVAINGVITGLSGLGTDSLVFGGNSGILTTTPIVSGISQILGVSLDPTTLLIEQKQPIKKI
jgi:hypothetical protein